MKAVHLKQQKEKKNQERLRAALTQKQFRRFNVCNWQGLTVANEVDKSTLRWWRLVTRSRRSTRATPVVVECTDIDSSPIETSFRACMKAKPGRKNQKHRRLREARADIRNGPPRRQNNAVTSFSTLQDNRLSIIRESHEPHLSII